MQTNGTRYQQHVGLAVLSFKLSTRSAIQQVKNQCLCSLHGTVLVRYMDES